MDIRTVRVFLVTLIVTCLASLMCEARPAAKSVHGSRLARSLNLPSSASDDYDNFYRGYLPAINQMRFAADKRAAMGIDLPDYILHHNGKPMPMAPYSIGNYRDKMQKNGKK